MKGKNRPFFIKLVSFILLLILLLPLSGGWAQTDKVVLLTFDDGPDSRYTPEILSTLKENDIKALFFVIGSQIEANPGLFQIMIKQGHTIGNHTWNHRRIDKLAEQELIDEVLQTDESISFFTGKTTVYFRPPRGCYTKENEACLLALGKINLLWDLGLETSGETDPKALVDRLLKRMRNKRELILLLHDGNVDGNNRTPTVEALPLLIKELRRRGYRFLDPASHKGQQLILRHAEKYQR